MSSEVAFFWHFHQPMYAKPEDGVLPLPWVRLHAIKDYLDMLRHVQKFPGLKVTFNFTPSLLRQILEYKDGRCTDRQLVLFRKRAEELTLEEKAEVLRDFFLANWTHMIEPYTRYYSLLLKRGKNIVEDELPAIAQGFSVEELRDLQVWSNLTWIDPIFREELGDLYKQGKNFTEQDKDRVMQVQDRIISSLIDEYKKAQESGQIELTTSPMYHPILPLLINSDLAKVSNPNLDIPFKFVHPEDAREQLTRGLNLFESCFGRKPRGIWPSEGSVCHELIPIIADLGVEWIATDEEILARSTNSVFTRDEHGVPANAAMLYKPWQVDRTKLVFRDHVLSDLIAFTYSTWDPRQGAQDFIARIKTIDNSLPSFEKYVIPVILDGENAWEYFDNDGSQFIDHLYEGLIKEKIPATTISDFLQRNEARNLSGTLFPGSWIGANFNIWIGRSQDHKAWFIVKDIREKLISKKIDDPALWDRFYILEGSDWFWWFGDDFFSVTSEVFDELFRTNAIWIYKKIGEEPPHGLFSSINQKTEVFCKPPIDQIRPVIDGKVTHFYEWFNSGCSDVKRMGGTMQRYAGLLSTIYYGFDGEKIYVRCDVMNDDIARYEYTIDIEKPKSLSLKLDAESRIDFKIGEILEIAIPYELLGIGPGAAETVEFVVRAWAKNTEIDRTPLLRFNLAEKDLTLHNWTV